MDLININDVRLEIKHIAAHPAGAYRNAALAPLVFLHEGLGSVAMWRDWPEQLCTATGRAGWVYSRRGYGLSDAVPDVRGASGVDTDEYVGQRTGQRTGRLLPDYLHEEAWTVLPALLKALKIDKPVLIGHSDGGSIALLHASRFPVSACIVMAPHVMVEDISIQSIQQARTAFEVGDLRKRLARFHADVDCAFWQWNDVWLSDAFRSFDIRSNCRTITAPLLAIQGVGDPYGSMRQIDEIPVFDSQNKVLPTSFIDSLLYKLEQCGHSPHRDQPELTTRLIAEFLARQA